MRLDSIDLSKCIEYREVLASTQPEYNAALEKILEHQHSQVWPHLSCRPGWKITVLTSTLFPSGKMAFDVVFAFHHAIADGLSGLVFHRSLLEALESPTVVNNVGRHVRIPESVTLPPPLEHQIDFKVSWPFLVGAFWNEYKPTWLKFPGKVPAWTSTPIAAEQIERYQSRCKILDIGPGQLKVVLKACREEKTTLTSLFHGIIVTSLTTHVPQARRFEGGVPYSVRHLLRASAQNEIGEFSTGHLVSYTPETVSRNRTVTQIDRDATEHIWDISRVFRESLRAELARTPNNNTVGLIPYVKNLHEAYKSRIGASRGQTFEVSNLGAFVDASESGKWRIGKIVFSQSGMGSGPALSFNVVSVAGGQLSMTATWMEGALEETLVDDICRDVMHFLKRLSKSDLVS